MAKFVLIFHGGETPEEPSPDVMDGWMAWFGELGEAVVDMGAPFGASATIASDGTPSEGSGPDPARGYRDRGSQPSRCGSDGQGLSRVEQRRIGEAL